MSLLLFSYFIATDCYHCTLKLVSFSDDATSVNTHLGKTSCEQTQNGNMCLQFEAIGFNFRRFCNVALLSISFFFLNSILFAICTSTFSKLCVTYTLTCRRELSSAQGSRPVVALGKKTYKLNLKN
jgi:hypothetical protein